MQISLAILCALEGEASPIIDQLSMQELTGHFDHRLGFKLFISTKYPSVSLTLFGKCKFSGVDRIGTQAASLACWETIKTLSPKMIGSVGTAGGFKSRGANIGDVFLSEFIFFHGRHIPVPGYESFELGKFPALNIKKPLNLKLGVVSSGDSVPASEIDLKRMEEIGTDAKDMEAAAIAEVCRMADIPVFAIKSITDFVDSSETTHGQFIKNYSLATEKLAAAISILTPQLISE